MARLGKLERYSAMCDFDLDKSERKKERRQNTLHSVEKEAQTVSINMDINHLQYKIKSVSEISFSVIH